MELVDAQVVITNNHSMEHVYLSAPHLQLNILAIIIQEIVLLNALRDR